MRKPSKASDTVPHGKKSHTHNKKSAEVRTTSEEDRHAVHSQKFVLLLMNVKHEADQHGQGGNGSFRCL